MTALVALVVALFAALPSASAEGLGNCASGLAELGIGDTCEVPVPASPTVVADDGELGDANAVQSSNDDVATISDAGVVTAVTSGSATITVRTYTEAVAANPNANPPVAAVAESTDDVVYSIAVRKVSVTGIAFGARVDQQETPTPDDATDDTFVPDSDNIFKSGTDIVVQVTSSFSSGNAVTFTVTAPTTGLSLLTGQDATPTAQRLISAATGDDDRDEGKVTVKSPVESFTLVTDGAPDGEYIITATANDTANTSPKFTARLTIGEAGNTVASASLTLGLREGFLTPTATDDKAETGSDSAGGDVNLVLNVQNGIGNNANAADVDEIRIVAPFGDIAYLSSGAFVEVDDNTIPGSALSKGSVIVRVKSQDAKERSVDVHAIVLGSVSGVATTEQVNLTFTGAANAISIDDGTKTLRNVNVEKDDDDNLVDDTISLVVNSTDKSGNTTSPPLGLGFTIDDPDGNAVGADKISTSQPAQGKDGLWRITITNESGDSAATALKTGTYTLTAKSGDIEDSATFTVAGAATSVSVSVDDMNPSAYGTITATATVADDDGVAAADDTAVEFTSSNENVLKEVGDTTSKNTKDGSVTQQFAVVGPGTALIIANVGNVSDVAVVVSTAGSAAAADEEVTLSCLSELSGLSTWTCDADSTASELFNLLAGRGASAVLLWNGTTWVRFAAIDGRTLPGAGNDFPINKFDSLWISY